MLFRPLLATLLAAAPAAALALSDLNCVGIDSCIGGTCTPSFLTYEIDFDWPAETAALTVETTDEVLTLQASSAGSDYTSGNMFFIGPSPETAPALILSFAPSGITATYSAEPAAPHHRAACAPQGAS